MLRSWSKERRDDRGGRSIPAPVREGAHPDSKRGRLQRLTAPLRRNPRLVLLLSGVLLTVALIAAFAGWRYTIWRFESRELRMQAFEAFAAGDFARSSGLFAEYVARRPDDVSALNQLAVARLEASDATRQDLLEAAAALQQALELDPKHWAARRSLVQVQLRLGFFDEAEAGAAALFNAYPRDTFALSVLTQIKLQRGEYQAAITLADSVLAAEIAPDDLRDTALLVKAEAYLRMGQLEEAFYWVETCVKVSASNLRAQELYLQLAQRLGKPPAELARHARQLYEQHPEVVLNRLMYAAAVRAAAVRAGSRGEKEAAQEYGKLALDLLRGAATQPLTPMELNLVLQQLEGARASTDVMDVLRAQLGRDDAPWVLREFGRRAILTGRQEELLEQMGKVDAGAAGASSDLLGLRAVALSQLGRKEESRAIMMAVAARKGDAVAEAWGLLLAAQGDEATATASVTAAGGSDVERTLAVLDAALEADGTNPFFHRYRGKLLASMGSGIAARGALAEAARWAPYWSAPPMELATLYLQEGDATPALEWAQEAVRRDPRNMAARSTLAAAWLTQAATLSQKDGEAFRELVKAQAESDPSLLPLRVQAELATGHTDVAVGLIEGALGDAAADSVTQEVLRQLAMVAARADLPVADRVIAKLGEDGFTPVEAEVEFIRAASRDGLDVALGQLEKRRLTSAEAGNANWGLIRGFALEGAGREEAKAVLRGLSEAHRDDAAVQTALLASSSVWDDPPLVDAIITRAERASGSVTDAVRLARLRYRLHLTSDPAQWREALEELAKLVQQNSEHVPPEARVLLADAAAVLNEPRLELEQRELLRRQQPRNMAVAIPLARRLRQLGQREQADSIVARTTQEGGIDNLGTAREVASYYTEAGDRDQAITVLEQWYNREGRTRPADAMLGNLYIEANRASRGRVVAAALADAGTPAGMLQAAGLYARLGDAAKVNEVARRIDAAPWDEAERLATASSLMLAMNNVEGGLIKARAAVEAAPERVDLRLRLIAYLIRQGNLPGAIQVAAERPGDDPRLAALASQGELLAWGLNDPLARGVAGEMLEDPSQVAENLETLRLLRQVAEASQANRDAALNALLQQVARRPDRLTPQMAALGWLDRAGRYTELAVQAQRLLMVFPSSTAPAAAVAPALARAGRLADARSVGIAWRNRLIDPWPADQLLIAVAAIGPPEELRDRLGNYIDQVQRQPDADPRITRAVLVELLRAGQVDAAVAVLSPALARSPQWRGAWVDLTPLIAHDAEATRQWISGLGEALTGVIPQAEIDLHLARAWMASAQSGGGSAAYQKAQALLAPLAAQPNPPPDGLHMLGLASLKLRDYPAARSAFEKMLEKNPDDVPALNNLAMVLLDSQLDLDRALEFSQHALELTPGNPQILDTVARVFAAKGENQQALAHIERAIAAQPDQAEWWLFRAEILHATGQPDAALQIIAQLNDNAVIDTLAPEARQRLAMLRSKLVDDPS